MSYVSHWTVTGHTSTSIRHWRSLVPLSMILVIVTRRLSPRNAESPWRSDAYFLHPLRGTKKKPFHRRKAKSMMSNILKYLTKPKDWAAARAKTLDICSSFTDEQNEEMRKASELHFVVSEGAYP